MQPECDIIKGEEYLKKKKKKKNIFLKRLDKTQLLVI